MELDVGEDLDRRLEAQQGAALARVFQALERVDRLAQGVFLLVVAAVAPDLQPQVLGQRIHDRHADAVQAAGNLVAVVVELAAGVQHGEDHLGRRDAFFLVDVDRNAATVVGDRAGAVFVQGDDHLVGVAGEGLVDRVVHHFEDHVVQAGAVVHVADVHTRTLAHGFQTTQDGDLAGVVGLGGFDGGVASCAGSCSTLGHGCSRLRRRGSPGPDRGLGNAPRHMKNTCTKYSGARRLSGAGAQAGLLLWEPASRRKAARYRASARRDRRHVPRGTVIRSAESPANPGGISVPVTNTCAPLARRRCRTRLGGAGPVPRPDHPAPPPASPATGRVVLGLRKQRREGRELGLPTRQRLASGQGRNPKLQSARCGPTEV